MMMLGPSCHFFIFSPFNFCPKHCSVSNLCSVRLFTLLGNLIHTNLVEECVQPICNMTLHCYPATYNGAWWLARLHEITDLWHLMENWKWPVVSSQNRQYFLLTLFAAIFNLIFFLSINLFQLPLYTNFFFLSRESFSFRGNQRPHHKRRKE